MVAAPSIDIALPSEPLRMTQLARPFDRLVGKIRPSTLSIRSMMSVAERRFLFGLASQYYSGNGVIVDAGIFLGASTRCFGDGIRENENVQKALARWQRPVVSFERGIVTPTMPAFFKRNGIEFAPLPGDSFEELVSANVKPVSDVVDLRMYCTRISGHKVGVKRLA